MEWIWEFLAHMSEMKVPTFERTIVKILETILDYLYDEEVIGDVILKCTMEYMVDRKRTFKNYPYCRYVMDVTFQQSNRPPWTMEEGNL